MSSRGRPKGRGGRRPNHHLKLVGGVWQVRVARNGQGDIRLATGLPKEEVEKARAVRDRVLSECAEKAHELTRRSALGLPDASNLKGLVALYLAAESKPYDRELGGKQPGTHKDWEGDRVIERRLFEVLDGSMSAEQLDGEGLLDLASDLEDDKLAAFTRRNVFRFLSRVYCWGRANKRKTGVLVSPFDDFDKRSVEWRRLFPSGVDLLRPPFTREQLRALYEWLPDYERRPVRFDGHTGLRTPSELLKMTCGRINWEARSYRVDPRWAKFGKERLVPLNDVALAILREAGAEEADPSRPVWLKPNGRPLKSFRMSFDAAVRKVCPAPDPGWRYPTPHSLRDTLATALESVSSKATVAKVLGHGPRDVTDLYLKPAFEAALGAVRRAAILIDGQPTEGVVYTWSGDKTMAEKMADGSFSA